MHGGVIDAGGINHPTHDPPITHPLTVRATIAGKVYDTPLCRRRTGIATNVAGLEKSP
jgi:hypothetical protein